MTAHQKAVRRYFSLGGCGQTARKRKLRQCHGHLWGSGGQGKICQRAVGRTPGEVSIDVPFGLWTRDETPFSDSGPMVPDKQYKGVTFSGGVPPGPPKDRDNNIAFDNIRLVKLRLPLLLSAHPAGSALVRMTFSEPPL